ncbi:MAG: hypothetical protein A3K10_05700 [Bacteroidetes bacterium RIFCSPLOWO2_12_FULL_31_6]|nr:MAG: hypothetical protein A3K10_05700 [Bacteroidetes bacterium RIFCSPLOWO2_12_FULL_31_6]
MKKVLIISFLLIVELNGFGQNESDTLQKDEIFNEFKNKNYTRVIELCNEKLQSDSTDINALLGIGRAYTSLNEFNLAIPYLLKVKNNATESWQISWSMIDLMTSYYGLGKINEAKEYYDKALKIKGAISSESSLKNLGLLFGFDIFYETWETVEKDNITFHFQKTSSVNNLDNYIKERELAFSNINAFFISNMPKKIDFFVWKSNADAEKILHTSLGFTKPQYCVSHNRSDQTKGHEIAHNISFWRDKNNVRTRLINEGIGVYFDQSNLNRMTNARKVAVDTKIDIKDMWLNGNNYQEQTIYPVAGAWVGALALFDKKKFLTLSVNQTYENALIIYGDELDSMIEEFNKRVNKLK